MEPQARKVYPVAAFNRRLAGYLARVRDVWVEGEVSELRRNAAWATVFLTLKDPGSGACLPATKLRRVIFIFALMSLSSSLVVRHERHRTPTDSHGPAATTMTPTSSIAR